jgi:UDP-N-acetyl-D-glucosamine dehydrogenase
MQIPAEQRAFASEVEDERAGAFALLLQQRRATVGVVGQGYVGFPLAQRAAGEGFDTIGFDIDPAVVRARAVVSGSAAYRASSDLADLRTCDVIVVAVPTPTRRIAGEVLPDLTNVCEAARLLRTHVLDQDRPRLLIFESTYAPGTTRERIAPLLADRLAPAGSVWLGYSPERIDPGNPRHTLANTPKITSGHGAIAARLTHMFYSMLVEEAVAASSLEAAEATKLLENTFRLVNIAFAQEFDSYCERAGLDAREITALAATKPFGFLPFYAGAGIGGHCIAEDPYYLQAAMREAGAEPTILQAALANHEQRAAVIVARVRAQLPQRSLCGRRILLLGVAYKPNVADVRRAPAGRILRLLEEQGADVAYHDPLVPAFAGRRSIDLAQTHSYEYDLAVVLTAHDAIDLDDLARRGWPLYDTRGTLRPVSANGAQLSSPTAAT